MDSVDYRVLYALQDRVLEAIFSTENEFYLTGGTCLSRFYKEKRFSDDLDFFANASNRFSFAVKNIKLALQKRFAVNAEIESKDFVRYRVDHILQIDFVNDIAYRYKDVIVTDEGYIIENVENILSNKITAIMGRDNPKDIFDIYLIAKYYTFSWDDILESAHLKAGFSDDELLIRLKSFPENLMTQIRLKDPDFLKHFKEEFPVLIEELSHKSDHKAMK